MIGKTAVIFLDMQKIVWEMKHMNLRIWPPISTVKIRFQDSRKLWSASTFLDFIEDSILKSQYKNYIKLISSLGSSEDRCSQGHHETFKLLWEAIWGNSSCEPHHHSCCNKINNRKCLQRQQLEELTENRQWEIHLRSKRMGGRAFVHQMWQHGQDCPWQIFNDKKWVAFYNVREFVENFKADFKIRSEEDCSHAWWLQISSKLVVPYWQFVTHKIIYILKFTFI